MQSGGQPYFTGFVRDLTEQQQTQARLQELQSELVHVSRLTAMGEMASTLAHELNQPLSRDQQLYEGLAPAAGGQRRCQRAEDRSRAGPRRRTGASRRPHHPATCATSSRAANPKSASKASSKLIEEAGALGLVGAREQDVQLRFSLDPDVRSGAGRPGPDPAGSGQPDPQCARGDGAIDAPRADRLERQGRGRHDRSRRLRYRGRDSQAMTLRQTCSSHSSRPRRPAWASASRSAARSSRPMAAGCGPKATVRRRDVSLHVARMRQRKDMIDAEQG